MHHRRYPRGARWPVVLLALAAVLLGLAADREMDDEEFVRFLAAAGADERVDRKRLARLFFSVASTLNAGKSNARLLQARLSFRDPSQETVRDLAESTYDAYAANLGDFQGATGVLLDEPVSDLAIYEAMMDGLETCWSFDRYSRVVETYGATSEDLYTVLPTMEGCARFRRAVFVPSVRAILRDGLAAPGYQQGKIEELREELAALEELLRDLAEIDEED